MNRSIAKALALDAYYQVLDNRVFRLLLVLAGILARQADELKAAYAPYCDLQVSDEEDGWILMTAQCA